MFLLQRCDQGDVKEEINMEVANMIALQNVTIAVVGSKSLVKSFDG